jgi:hypothetical protein
LNEFDGFYVSEQIVSERSNLLREIAQLMLDSGVLPPDRIILRQGRIPLLTRGYFLLNRAYKDWRIPDGHFTERPKIAAIQCMAIARFEPFTPVFPNNAVNIAEYRCNEIFACSYAMGILGKSFVPNTPEKIDFWLRLLDVISEATVETLEPYIVDVNHEIKRPLAEYTMPIHPADKLVLNSLISIFELISDKSKLLD